MKRYYIVDALRAVLALCVAIGHVGIVPIFGEVGQANTYLDFLARAWRTAVFGPPAVIVFFVISGFCIHLPFASRGISAPFLRFYVRRYSRILFPLIAVVVLYELVWPETVIFGKDSILWHSTLWSIVCEEIYYAAYPFINRLQSRFGWPRVLLVAFAAAAIVALSHISASDWSELGIIGTTLVLFPVWLLGCQLAEGVSLSRNPCSGREIWTWRFCAWTVMWIAGLLHFHGPIHQTQSGIFVGIFAYFWLRAELKHERIQAPWRTAVWAGHWSYSLYLVHPIIFGILAWYVVAGRGELVWMINIAAVLIAAYLFYLVVERPSHRLARKVALFDSSKQQVQPAAI